MKMYKKIALVLIIVIVFCTIMAPVADAAVTPYFGGKIIGMWPCTCAAGAWAWFYFFPLYTMSGIPGWGALTGSYSTWFATYVLKPNSYAIGHYTPVTATCWTLAPIPADPCIMWPDFGFILPDTGVSPTAAI